MTLNDIYTRLQQTGLPVAYSHFEAPQVPPYICYMETDSDNFAADNRMYYPVQGVRVELYTAKKDLEAEAHVAAALQDLFFDTHETYVAEEKLRMVIYEIEV